MIVWSDEILYKLSLAKPFSLLPKEQIESVLQNFCLSFYQASEALDKNFVSFSVFLEKYQSLWGKKKRFLLKHFCFFVLEGNVCLKKEKKTLFFEKNSFFLLKEKEQVCFENTHTQVVYFSLQEIEKFFEDQKASLPRIYLSFFFSLSKHFLELMLENKGAYAPFEKTMAKERLLQQLFLWAEKQKDTTVFHFLKNRRFLAEELGMSRQHLEKCLKQLKDEKKITYTAKTYQLLE